MGTDKNQHNKDTGSNIERSDERIAETQEVFTPMEMCEEMEIHATPLLLIYRRDLPAKVATNWQPGRSIYIYFFKSATSDDFGKK